MFLPTLGCVILTAVVGFFKIFLSLIQSGLLYCPINEWKQKQKREKEKGKNWKGRSAGEKGSKKEKPDEKIIVKHGLSHNPVPNSLPNDAEKDATTREV